MAFDVQGHERQLGVDGGLNGIRGVAGIGEGSTPEGHDAVADVLVQCSFVLLDAVGDGAEVGADGAEGFTGLGVVVSFGVFLAEFMLLDEFSGVDLGDIGQFGEAADIGKIDCDFAPVAADGEGRGAENFINDIR